MIRLRIGNNGHPGLSVIIRLGTWHLRIGWWCYGWENLAYYKRFDHLRIVAFAWRSNAKQGDRFYRARGLDYTIVLRDDGRWVRPRRHA